MSNGPGTNAAMAKFNPREERGRMLANDKRIKRIAGTTWSVPSQSKNAGSYVVNTLDGTCTCTDHETRRSKCKHLWAVEMSLEVTKTIETKADGSTVTTETVKVTRKTYSQDWPAYNAAQCAEKAIVQNILRNLCEGIRTPPHEGRGRKPLALSDADARSQEAWCRPYCDRAFSFVPALTIL